MFKNRFFAYQLEVERTTNCQKVHNPLQERTHVYQKALIYTKKYTIYLNDKVGYDGKGLIQETV